MNCDCAARQSPEQRFWPFIAMLNLCSCEGISRLTIVVNCVVEVDVATVELAASPRAFAWFDHLFPQSHSLPNLLPTFATHHKFTPSNNPVPTWQCHFRLRHPSHHPLPSTHPANLTTTHPTNHTLHTAYITTYANSVPNLNLVFLARLSVLRTYHATVPNGLLAFCSISNKITRTPRSQPW